MARPVVRPPEFILQLVDSDCPKIQNSRDYKWFWLELPPEHEPKSFIEALCSECPPRPQLDLVDLEEPRPKLTIPCLLLTPKRLGMFNRIGTIFFGQCLNCQACYWSCLPKWKLAAFLIQVILGVIDSNESKLPAGNGPQPTHDEGHDGPNGPRQPAGPKQSNA